MPNAVDVSDLSVEYGSKNLVLNRATLSVERGQIFGLLGPSGCGKTTLVSYLLSLVKPMKGSVIRLFGHSISKCPKDVGIPGPNAGKGIKGKGFLGFSKVERKSKLFLLK